MPYKKAYLTAFLVLMMALPGPAQPSLCLNECLAYAWENNLELMLYVNDLEKSKLRVSQAGREFLPSLSAEHHHYISTGRSLNLEDYSRENEDIQQGNMALNVELKIFQGLSGLYDLRVANSSLHLAELKLRKQRWLLGIEIIRCFYSILLCQTDLEIMESNLKLTRHEINRIEELIASGSKPGAEIYEMKAQENMETIKWKQLLLNKNRKNKELEALLNWKEPGDLLIDYFNKTYKEPSLYEFRPVNIPTMIQNSLQLALEEEAVKMSQLEYRKQSSGYYPRISAHGLLSSHYLKGALNFQAENPEYRYAEQIQDNYVLQLGLSISVPIYDMGRSGTTRRLNELDIENAKLRRQLVKNDLEMTLFLLINEIESLRGQIHESQKLCHSLLQSYEAAREKYNAGLLDAFSLNLIRNKQLEAQLNLNRLETEYWMNVEVLGFYERYGQTIIQ